MKVYPTYSESRIREIIQYTIDSSNDEEMFIPEGELELDLAFLQKCSLNMKIKHYIELLERTRVPMLKKNFLEMLIECLMEKILKDHCS